MDNQKGPPVRHEDDDPLVVLATRVCGPEFISRRPGLLDFKLLGPNGAEIIVRRSRWDGNFGDVVRAAVKPAGHDAYQTATLVPTFHMVETIELGIKTGSADHLFALVGNLVAEWSQKGQNGNTKT